MITREMKFRAWNTRDKRMTGTLGLHNAYHYADESYVWMQFTGLLDKNGKEIYEGDIIAAKFQPHYVERVSWKGEPDAVCTVFWDYNGFRLSARGTGDKRFADFSDFERLEYHDELMVSMTSEYSEVIGNIYENPELLEEAA